MITCAADAAAQGPRVAVALDSRIPAADSSQYREIRDAKEWKNPKVTILPTGIEVESEALPSGRKTVGISELRALLIGLPVSAWPYGRVVLATDIGILAAVSRDEAAIRANHQRADAILRQLRIEVEWWPS
jgi:hypothetical protein